MTTKMSAAHEITYSILVYLAAADGDGSGSASGDGGLNFGTNKKLDEKAPDIIGLEYKSETKLDYAKYFKIYHYDKDVTLLEIDMTKDTDNDPDKVKEDTEDGDTKKSDTKKTSTKTDSKKASKTSTKKTTKTDSKTKDSESVTYSDEGEVIGKTQEERTADLYRANVVKYLIVPEDSDVELPVGIEKEMIVVNLPVKHAYVDSEESLKTTDELKLLKKIAAVGFDQDETDIDAVNEALEEEDMIYAGSGEDLKFRELVKNKVDLAIVSSEILPGSKTEKAAKEEEEKDSKTTKTADTSTDKTDSKTKTADSKTKTADSKTTTADTDTEETTVLDSLADNFATLGVPLIVDRSGDEKTELAKAEWLKVYGAVFGCSKKTDKLYNKVVKAAESKKK